MSNNESKTIDLDVSGSHAVTTVKNALSGYDASDDDVSRISICVYEHTDADEDDEDDEVTDAPKPDGEKSGRSKIGSGDRKLKGVPAGSSYHLVLAALERVDDDEVSAKELADAIGVEQNPVSTVLSKLYRRKMVDREDGQRPYTYWISTYGRAELDERGRDVTPEDAGGVWSDD